MKAAVAIGGTFAFSACAKRAGRSKGTTTPEFPRGAEDLTTMSARQHAWSDYTA